MNTQIKYTNELGNSITAQEQALLIKYNKITYVDNSIKMIESFGGGRNANHKRVSYFLDPAEDKNAIIQRYSDAANYLKCILYLDKQSLNRCDSWNWESYSTSGQLTFKGVETYNNDHKLLFSCSLDLNTNQLIDRASKYYYANRSENEIDDMLLRFTYDVNGNINLIFDFHGYYGYNDGITLDEFLADDQFSQQDFPWDQHTYYHAATPYLPTGSL